MPTLITKSGTEHATASGAVWLRHFNAALLLFPCPASPDPMRHLHRVNPEALARSGPQAGCRVSPSPDGLPWCRASGFASREARPLPVFNKLPSASFQQQQSRASGQLNLSAIGGHPSHSQTNISSLHAAIRRPAQHVRRSRRLGGGGNRASVFALRASPRQAALVLGLLHARAREEEKAAPASRRGHVCGTPPTTPLRPRQDSVCVVFSRKARPENTHRILPPMAARFRHVSQADRVATPYGHCNPCILSAVAKCRRFPDWTRPPPLIRPRTLVNLLAVPRKAASEALPGDRPCAVSAPVRESASLDIRTVTAVNTSPKSPDSSPAVPGADCCHNPDDGM